jgi:aldose 1-epimerase
LFKHLGRLRAAGMRSGGAVAAADLSHPASGRRVVLRTNAPGLQVYSGNFLDGAAGKGGYRHKVHQSVCLESQTFPNGARETAFPSPVLWPGEEYRHEMVFELRWDA